MLSITEYYGYNILYYVVLYCAVVIILLGLHAIFSCIKNKPVSKIDLLHSILWPYGIFDAIYDIILKIRKH